MNAAANHIYREILAKIEEILVRRIEEIEGRVPSNQEITARARCLVQYRHMEGEELTVTVNTYTWRGQPLLEWFWRAGGATINELF